MIHYADKMDLKGSMDLLVVFISSILTLYGPNFFFVVFRDITKIGSFRLPTHRHATLIVLSCT